MSNYVVLECLIVETLKQDILSVVAIMHSVCYLSQEPKHLVREVLVKHWLEASCIEYIGE